MARCTDAYFIPQMVRIRVPGYAVPTVAFKTIIPPVQGMHDLGRGL